jgi:hypothetical protein
MESVLKGQPQSQENVGSWIGTQNVPANSAWRLLFDRRHLVSFIVTACMVIPVNLIGTFRLGELLVLVLYPFYMKQILKALRNREVLAIVGLGVLWFISQGLSDLYNATTMKNSLRGMGSIFLTLTTFLFFCGLYSRNPSQHLGTLLGACAGGVLSAGLLYRFDGNNPGYAENIWDFYVSGWAHPAFALFAFLFYRSHPWMVFPVGIAYGLVANMYGGRSDGLVVLISTLFFFYLWIQITHSRGDLRYSMRSGLVICALLLLPLFSLYVIYAQSGALGKAAKMQIDLAKNPYNPVEVLLLARNESVIALDAIYEKPILGHGSWANPGHLRRLYLLKMREIYGASAPKKLIQDILPVHSVLLGAWVFGGLAGFVFWVYVIFRTFHLSNQLLLTGSIGMTAIAVVYVPYFCWHVLFSPNAFARFSWPMSMAFIIFSVAFFHRSMNDTKR